MTRLAALLPWAIRSWWHNRRFANHTFPAGTVEYEPQSYLGRNGYALLRRTCTGCGYESMRIVPKLGIGPAGPAAMLAVGMFLAAAWACL